MFTDYYSISPGMVSLTPGKGAFYGIAFNDADDTPMSGDYSYKLTLPPDVPAKLFWSLTLYEAENASGLATDARRLPSALRAGGSSHQLQLEAGRSRQGKLIGRPRDGCRGPPTSNFI